MLADQPPPVAGPRAPLDIRIHADGEVPPEVTAELGGLVASRVPGGTLLQGTVVDAAELWGVLHRLHRAGLRLRSVVYAVDDQADRQVLDWKFSALHF